MILSLNFFINSMLLFVNNIFTILTKVTFIKFYSTISFVGRAKWWFKFRLLNICLFIFSIIFYYQFLNIISNNFLIFTYLNFISKLISSSERFWFMTKSYYDVLSWMNFITMIFYFYILFTIEILHSEKLKHSPLNHKSLCFNNKIDRNKLNIQKVLESCTIMSIFIYTLR